MSEPLGDLPQIGGLEELLRGQERRSPAPVESWNPTPCGDIGLRIKPDGTWIYAGTPIARKPLVQLFARVLRRDPDGQFFLVTPVEKVPIVVEDAPFLAVEMQIDGHGRQQRITFRTNVDDIVCCGTEHPLHAVRESGTDGVKPYVHVRGRLEALLTRALTFDLLNHATVEDGDAGIGIWSGGAFFSLAPLPPAKPKGGRI